MASRPARQRRFIRDPFGNSGVGQSDRAAVGGDAVAGPAAAEPGAQVIPCRSHCRRSPVASCNPGRHCGCATRRYRRKAALHRCNRQRTAAKPIFRPMALLSVGGSQRSVHRLAGRSAGGGQPGKIEWLRAKRLLYPDKRRVQSGIQCETAARVPTAGCGHAQIGRIRELSCSAPAQAEVVQPVGLETAIRPARMLVARGPEWSLYSTGWFAAASCRSNMQSMRSSRDSNRGGQRLGGVALPQCEHGCCRFASCRCQSACQWVSLAGMAGLRSAADRAEAGNGPPALIAASGPVPD